jgi:hypothetical protein
MALIHPPARSAPEWAHRCHTHPASNQPLLLPGFRPLGLLEVADLYPPRMVQTTAEARQQLLDTVGEATDQIGSALAALGAAYEQLDEASADQLEQQLFRPVQLAYGRARRTHAEFAARVGLASRKFEPQSAGLPSTGAKGFIESAVTSVGRADNLLATLQDSMLPVEVGDPELRAALADLREIVAGISRDARELVRTLGR